MPNLPKTLHGPVTQLGFCVETYSGINVQQWHKSFATMFAMNDDDIFVF